MNDIKRILYWSLDFVPRIWRKVFLTLARNQYFANNQKVSDSLNTGYVQSIERILSSDKNFRTFRRKFGYREILEHVDFNLGKNYLNRINELGLINKIQVHELVAVDNVGKPRKFKYSDIFNASPTTLRYLSVTSEILNNFETSNFGKITEVGAGYGGQCLYLSKFINFTNYTIFDLPAANKLIERFLTKVNNIDRVIFGDISNIENVPTDFFLSNYAFSELNRSTQQIYLERIISKSKSGYMIMNSGMNNETGRTEGKFTVSEIMEYLPSAVVAKEVPLSGPDNYVLMWGVKKPGTSVKK